MSSLSSEIEKEKEGSEESKEGKDSELEDFYMFHNFRASLVQFDYHLKKEYVIKNEKLVSQVHKEISTPPPNC